MQQTKFITLWRCARPSFLLLTPCCLSLAVAFALTEHYQLEGFKLLLITSGALSAHISVNLLNEFQDFQSGLDLRTQRTAFSGGSGALPEAPEYAKTVRLAGLICLIFTLCVGLFFVWSVGWRLMPLGLAGVLLVYFYSPQITHRPWLCLLAPGLGFGPIMISGAHYLLTGHVQPVVWLTSLIILLLVSNLLLLNQFPDVEPDRDAGRLTLPILLGRKKAAQVYAVFLLLAYALLILAVSFHWLPSYSLIGLATLLLALPTAIFVLRFHDDTIRLMPALGMNVALTLSLPLLIALGLIWQSLV